MTTQNAINRKITPLRIALHVGYWLFDIYSNYSLNTMVIKCPNDQDCQLQEIIYLMVAEHTLVSIGFFYAVSLLVVPPLILLLIDVRRVSNIRYLVHPDRLLSLGKIVMLVIVLVALLNIQMYYFFRWIAQNYPNTPRGINAYISPGGELHEYGPLGIFRSYSVSALLWAFYLADIVLPILIKMVREAVAWGQQSTELAEEKVQHQLAFLKQQINPHFLFNVLNSVQAKIFDVSPIGYRIINQLASILRFSLDKGNQEWVQLTDEVQFIQNYLQLEKQRLQQSARIEFRVNGDIDEYELPPLLLITFIENAFKHGLQQLEEGGYVVIELTILNKDPSDRHHLLFTVENDKPPGATSTVSNHVGLVNVKQRLALLYPSGQYTLRLITDHPTLYRVDLTIPLRLTTQTSTELILT